MQGGATGGLALGFGALAALRAAERVVLAVDGDPAGQDRGQWRVGAGSGEQEELRGFFFGETSSGVCFV